jgi:regulatory protein
MIVTRIERQKRHPDRVNIYLDGAFAFGLDEEVFLRHGLRKGDAVDERLHRELLGAEEQAKARTSALRYLSYRLRSEREIRAKLAEKEFAHEIIDRVVEQLRSAGLVDDRRFAAAFVHDARLRKATGARLLRQQLLAKGVPRALVEDVVEEATERSAEQSAALGAARSLLGRYRASRKPVDDATGRRRVAQFLARRGFGWDVITPVLRTLFTDPDSPPEDTDHGIDRL